MVKTVALAIYGLLILVAGCSSTSQSTQHGGRKDIMEIQVKAEQAYSMARLDQSESLYLQVLESIPNYAPAWFRLGNIYTRTGRQEAAINAYRRCIELEPTNKKALYNMSLVRLKQSTQLLELAVTKAASPSPVDPKIQALLSELYDLQGSGNHHQSTVDKVGVR